MCLASFLQTASQGSPEFHLHIIQNKVPRHSFLNPLALFAFSFLNSYGLGYCTIDMLILSTIVLLKTSALKVEIFFVSDGLAQVSKMLSGINRTQ